MGSGLPSNRLIVIPSKSSEVRRVSETILAEIRRENYSGDDIFGIHLAMEEALINAIRHGNGEDSSKEVCIEYLVTKNKIEITITDEGQGFDLKQVPDPRCGENIYKTDGRGVFLMRSYTDLAEYNDIGNCVRLVKYRTGICKCTKKINDKRSV